MGFHSHDKGFFGNLGDKVSNVFRPPPDPKEAVRKWTSQIRIESRKTDRSIREIGMEQAKAHKLIKAYAKKGELESAKIVARECVNAKKTIERMHMQKAYFLDMECALKEQMAMAKVAGSLQKSTVVMSIVNDMMKIPQLQQTMMEMSKEMMKAGLVEEMMNDAISDAMDTEETDQASEMEVNKILLEIAGEDAASLPTANTTHVETAQEQAADAQLMADLAAGVNPNHAQANGLTS